MQLNRKAVVYITCLCLGATKLLVYLVMHYPAPDLKVLLLWSLMAIIATSLPISLPSSLLKITAGYSVAVVAVLLDGPLTGVLVMATGFLAWIQRTDDGINHLFNTPFYKTILNVSQVILATGSMGLLYQLLGGVPGEPAFIPAVLTTVIGILLNSFILSGLLAMITEDSFWLAWKTNFGGIFAINIIQGVYGSIIALVSLTNQMVAVFLFFATLYIVRHLLKQQVEIMNNYMATMQIINRLVEAKDPYTYGHASRVQEFAVKLAEALGLKQHVIENIKRAAQLHDIGKIGVNDAILNKPGPLTKKEYKEVKRHPVLGAEIIAQVPQLKDAVDIVLYHHERPDGLGYPKGLRGDEIPVGAGVIAIADAYDAMTSDRPYRKALSKEEALKEIEIYAGTQFNAHFAEVFLQIMQGKTKDRMRLVGS